MNTDTKATVGACLIGGVILFALTLILSPNFWPLGFIAGVALGYLVHKFPEAPKVLVAMKDDALGLLGLVRCIINEAGEIILTRPRPCFLPGAVLGLLVAITIIKIFAVDILVNYENTFFHNSWTPFHLFWNILFARLAAYFIGLIFTAIIITAMTLLISWLAFKGASLNGCHWPSFFYDLNCKMVGQEEELTYKNSRVWVDAGVRYYSKNIPLGIYLAIGSLLKAVRSRKCLLCAIGGIAGGLIAYFWLREDSMASYEKILLIIFGWLIGSGASLLAWTPAPPPASNPNSAPDQATESNLPV